MRESLLKLINETFVFEYTLPNLNNKIDKANVSKVNDFCYSVGDTNSLKEIIYNGIIEYSFNEYDIDYGDLESLHVRALKTKIRYDEYANGSTKIKYGFFGEVILFSILHVLFGTDILISRGYFYNPLENSEAKGYDCYHLIQKKEGLEMRYGEAKFHSNFKSGIDDIFGKENFKKGKKINWKIEQALSDSYLSKNILAIIGDHENNLNTEDTIIAEIIKSWKSNPNINLAEELTKYNVKLVYPILVLYQGEQDYNRSIKNVVDYINSKYPSINPLLSLNYSLFFIFLPLAEVKEIKSDVISWIDGKKLLIS